MKKILVLFIMLTLLMGCSQSEFHEYKDNYIKEQHITNVEEVFHYENKPYIEGVIFKGKIDQEELYYYEGIQGNAEGFIENGMYSGQPLFIEEKATYYIHNGEDYRYDKSFFVGIVYQKLSEVYFKGESIKFDIIETTLNDEDITLIFWLMPFDNGEEVSISDFELKE